MDKMLSQTRMRTIKAVCCSAWFLVLVFSPAALANFYSGGTGEPNDPFQIATAEDLNDIGNHEDHWDKHFLMVADIDLASYTGTQFRIIGVSFWDCQPGPGPCVRVGTAFSGTFNGGGHTINNFTYETDADAPEDFLGLFGAVDGPGAEIKNLTLANCSIGSEHGDEVGTLVGYLVEGKVTRCSVYDCNVVGDNKVGGLIGLCGPDALVSDCYAVGSAAGEYDVGGLAGSNRGIIQRCFAGFSAEGKGYIGGLVGLSSGSVDLCHTKGRISGQNNAGGLVGQNRGRISNCYSMTVVEGQRESTGGLIGANYAVLWFCYAAGAVSEGGGLVGWGGGAFGSYWDLATTGCNTSSGGGALTTAEMQRESTFAGWGGCGNEGVWTIEDGNDYPRLSWENKPGLTIPAQQLSDLLEGSGRGTDPYLIYTSADLNLVGLFPCEWNKHFRLMADIDLVGLTGSSFNMIGYDISSHEEPFTGVFDGNGHAIANFTYDSEEKNVALFGYVRGGDAEIRGVRLIAPQIEAPRGTYTAPLVGRLKQGVVARCCSVGGSVLGYSLVGGLVGLNREGSMTECCSTTDVTGRDDYVGGLIGWNMGMVSSCQSSGAVAGDTHIGGLVGSNLNGTLVNCYASGDVSGSGNVGGLAGSNDATIEKCYSSGSVSGARDIGGLVGDDNHRISHSFWDVDTSGQPSMCGRESQGSEGCDNANGKSTSDMQAMSTFSDAEWDFLGQLRNGTDDVWTIDEGRDYPRLVWQVVRDFAGGDVDFGDYCLVADYWQRQDCADSDNCAGVDVDFSGDIGFTDLRVLTQYWLNGGE